MMPPLSHLLAAAIIRALATAVPGSYRRRWREEWLAEIEHAEPGGRVVWRALAAWRDVLACRRHFAPPPPETASFGLRRLDHDVRHSVRAIRRSPGFTIAAVASLTVGIAAATTAFSAVNALLFRSLPGVKDADRLVHVYTNAPWLPPGASLSPEASYQHYRETLNSLTSVAAFATVHVAIGASADPTVRSAELVTPEYFETIAVAPAAGRLLDASAASDTVAVASHDLAVREFGSPGAAVGRTITVNGVAFEIIGVTPRGFIGVRARALGKGGPRPQLWLSRALRPLLIPGRAPLVNRSFTALDGSWVEIVGRLAPGVSVAQAIAAAAAVPPHIGAGRGADARPQITPLGRGSTDSTAAIAAVVAMALGIPLIVLAIGCANTANLQLARAAERQAEIAVKRSLGATRGLIVRQMLFESVLVAAIAGALAVVITLWATSLLEGYLPVPCPVDWRVLTFAIGVVLMTGIGFGIAPALGSTRGNLSVPLKASGSTSLHSRSRLRSALMVAQVSLSILLLMMAGLFTRSLRHLQEVGTERDMSHVAAATIDLGLLKYTEARGRRFQEELLQRIERSPGVVAAAIAPFEPFGLTPGLTYRPDDYSGRLPYLYAQGGAPLGRFVETAGLRVISGRGFTENDRLGTPKVALVSEALAKQLAPSGAAVGRRLLVADGLQPSNEVTIVGITADAALQTLRRDPPAMFLPGPLNYDLHVTLWVRTFGDPAAILPVIRQIVRDLDPQLPIRRLDTAEAWRAQEILPVRLLASGFSAMGMLAILLAGGGLYAVMSYLVFNRRHEMAVRLALGARPADLSRLVVAGALRLSIPGLVLGALLAALAARLARVMLFGVSPLDPIALGAVGLLLTAVAVAATLGPALRAARLDPLVTLRRE